MHFYSSVNIMQFKHWLQHRVLRRIYGSKREEVAAGWRRLHKEELHNLYASPNNIIMIAIWRMRWEHVARMGEMRSACNVMVRKPEVKRPFGRHRRRWEDNIRMDIRETGWENVDWMHLAQDRDQRRALVTTEMNLRVT
jgi:hypothetical protein